MLSQAGIRGEQLSILYEPEAVLIYLHYLGKQNKENTTDSEQQLDNRYIIVKMAGKVFVIIQSFFFLQLLGNLSQYS